MDEFTLLAGGLTLLGITRIGFISLGNFGLALLVVLIGGLCNGLNATTSRILRRRYSTNEQFPEIISLETIISKFTDWGVQSICIVIMLHGLLSYKQVVVVSMLSLWVLAFVVWKLRPHISSVALALQEKAQ